MCVYFPASRALVACFAVLLALERTLLKKRAVGVTQIFVYLRSLLLESRTEFEIELSS